MHVIDQPSAKVLPQRRGAPAEPHVFSARRLLGAIKSDAYAIRDEVECRASLHDERGASVMSEHKDRSMVNRVIAPPSLPTIVEPRAADGAKHVAAYDPCADVFEAPADHVVIQSRRSAFAPVHLLMSASSELPSEDSEASDAEWIGKILVRAGAVAIERY